MKAVIFYFSGTGNTLMVCREYQRQLQLNGVDCCLFSMENMQNLPDVCLFDFVGFAYPVHAFNAPSLVYQFVGKLPKVNNVNYFIVNTSGEPLKMNNASSVHLRKVLGRKGFCCLTNEYHYVMPYNIIFRHTDLQAQKMWNVARQLVEIDVLEILQGKVAVLKRPFLGGFVSWLLRIEQPAMKANGGAFRVKDSCIKCMKCVNNCPVGNIAYDKQKGKFHFGNKCVMCARCSFNCPKDSIIIGILNGWRVNGKYNFDNPNTTQICRKPNYCKKSYARYFCQAEQKIASYCAMRKNGENYGN